MAPEIPDLRQYVIVNKLYTISPDFAGTLEVDGLIYYNGEMSIEGSKRIKKVSFIGAISKYFWESALLRNGVCNHAIPVLDILVKDPVYVQTEKGGQGKKKVKKSQRSEVILIVTERIDYTMKKFFNSEPNYFNGCLKDSRVRILRSFLASFKAVYDQHLGVVLNNGGNVVIINGKALFVRLLDNQNENLQAEIQEMMRLLLQPRTDALNVEEYDSFCTLQVEHYASDFVRNHPLLLVGKERVDFVESSYSNYIKEVSGCQEGYYLAKIEKLLEMNMLDYEREGYDWIRRANEDPYTKRIYDNMVDYSQTNPPQSEYGEFKYMRNGASHFSQNTTEQIDLEQYMLMAEKFSSQFGGSHMLRVFWVVNFHLL